MVLDVGEIFFPRGSAHVSLRGAIESKSGIQGGLRYPSPLGPLRGHFYVIGKNDRGTIGQKSFQT